MCPSLAVSILVFLELAPGLLEVVHVADGMDVFQSLFFWNSRPDSERRLPSRSGYQFQSLFFWNSRPDENSICRETLINSCFNPCFSGTRARTPHAVIAILRAQGFNPCFSGTRARTLLTVQPLLHKSGFNPCFSGTRARTFDIVLHSTI